MSSKWTQQISTDEHGKNSEKMKDEFLKENKKRKKKEYWTHISQAKVSYSKSMMLWIIRFVVVIYVRQFVVVVVGGWSNTFIVFDSLAHTITPTTAVTSHMMICRILFAAAMLQIIIELQQVNGYSITAKWIPRQICSSISRVHRACMNFTQRGLVY